MKARSRRAAAAAVGLAICIVADGLSYGTLFALLAHSFALLLTGFPLFLIYSYLSYLPLLLAGLSLTAEWLGTVILAPLLYACFAWLLSRLWKLLLESRGVRLPL